MIAGCLNNDIRLVYRIQFPFDDEIVPLETSDPSVNLPFRSELQGTDFNVSITPVLADLHLVGTPLSTNLNEGKFIYLPITVQLHLFVK